MKKDINTHIEHIDSKLISFSHRFGVGALQIGLAIIFLWFGILKLAGVSSVEEIIIELVNILKPTLDAQAVLVGLGVMEILIALTIIDRHLLRLSIFFLIIHIVFVSLPLFLLTDITWSSFLVPTLAGQYILHNIIIGASAMVVLSDLKYLKDQFIPSR